VKSPTKDTQLGGSIRHLKIYVILQHKPVTNERLPLFINSERTIPIALDHKDPYTLLIAVLLSYFVYRMRVNNEITPILLKADNPLRHDKCQWRLKLFVPVVYAMKSKESWLSHILIDKHGGKVSTEF
jgi:hypothetical protein